MYLGMWKYTFCNNAHFKMLLLHNYTYYSNLNNNAEGLVLRIKNKPLKS